MQESNTTAQNKLGELYVEFGSKGLGGLMNGLNGVSAQFLLTKNAAEQAVKPIWGMAKKVGGSVVEFNKLNSVTGMSVSHLMNMKKWADLNSIDFSDYIGNLKSLQQAMAEALINRNPQTLQGFAMLGISPEQLDFKNPEKMLGLISKRIKDLDPVMRTVALGMVGLSEDMVYAMSKANKSLDESQKLNKDQLRNINEVNDATKELGVTWDTVGQTIIGNWENLDGIIKGVSDNIKKFIEFLDANPEKKITILADFVTNIGKNIKHFAKGFRADDKGATELALTGNEKEKEKLNFIGKLGYYGVRSGLYTGLSVARAFGNDTTMADVEEFYKGKFNKKETAPQTVKQNAKNPYQIGHYGNKTNNMNNQISFVINTQSENLQNPLGFQNILSQSITNYLQDQYQTFDTRYGDNANV